VTSPHRFFVGGIQAFALGVAPEIGCLSRAQAAIHQDNPDGVACLRSNSVQEIELELSLIAQEKGNQLPQDPDD
jgi:hypothetical protein